MSIGSHSEKKPSEDDRTVVSLILVSRIDRSKVLVQYRSVCQWK